VWSGGGSCAIRMTWGLHQTSTNVLEDEGRRNIHVACTHDISMRCEHSSGLHICLSTFIYP
jgi:hypothetical protein